MLENFQNSHDDVTKNASAEQTGGEHSDGLNLVMLMSKSKDPCADKDAVLKTAKDNLGQELWKGVDSVPKERGAAVAVSNVLRQTEQLDHIDLSTRSLVADLTKEGWQRESIENRKPGDIIVKDTGLLANVGIIDEKGNVMSNNSRTGIWTERDMHAQNWNYVLHKSEK